MSNEVGNGKRILSLDAARGAKKDLRMNDFITVQQAYDLIIQECAKVHEYYLEQIPTYAAKMIQDALRDMKLCKVVASEEGTLIIVPHFDPREEVVIPVAPVEAPAVPENAGGDTAPDATTEPAA